MAGCVPAIYFDISSQFLNLHALPQFGDWTRSGHLFDISSQILNLHVLPQFGCWTLSGHLFDISSRFTRAASIWWLDAFTIKLINHAQFASCFNISSHFFKSTVSLYSKSIHDGAY
jgi:hypothetical protein